MKTMVSALRDVQAEVTTIGKDGHNRHGGYDYTSADGAIAYGRPLLAKHGLVFTPMGQRYVGPIIPTTDSKDRPQMAVILECDFLLAFGAEERRWSSQIVVETRQGTPLDKATLGGRTELLGYALRDLLLFDRGDAVRTDISGRDDVNRGASRFRKAARPRATGELEAKNKQISELREELGMTSVETLALAKEVTGKPPSADVWTAGDADKLINHLKNLVLAQEVRGEGGEDAGA